LPASAAFHGIEDACVLCSSIELDNVSNVYQEVVATPITDSKEKRIAWGMTPSVYAALAE
jgi:hypothetical protein